MNFTRDNAEIPAWMMCTEGHENGLPAEVQKSPRGSASEKCLISQCLPSRSVAGDRLYFKIPTFRTGLGRRYTRCEVLPLQTKEHLCPNTGFYSWARILCHNQAKRPPRRGRSLKVMSNEDNYFLVTEILANLLWPDVPLTVKVTEEALPSHLPSA